MPWRLLRSGAFLSQDGGTRWICPIGDDIDNSTDETIVDIKIYNAYICTDLRVHMTQLDGGTGGVILLRDDGGDTTVAVTVTSTGWFEDLTDSATPAANSKINYEYDGAGMHDDQDLGDEVLMTIDHASDLPFMGGGGGATQSNNWFTPLPLNTLNFDIGSSTNKVQFPRSTILSNLFVVASSVSGTWDVGIGKNTAQPDSVEVRFTSSGELEDLTGSETYSDTDDASFRALQAVAGSINVSMWKVDADTAETFLGTQPWSDVTTRVYNYFDSQPEITSPDDNFFARLGSITGQNLSTHITAAGSGTRDVSLRVGSTNSTNVSISVTATGLAKDLTGSESIADDDSVMITIFSSGTGTSGGWAACEIPGSDVSGGVARRIFITSS